MSWITENPWPLMMIFTGMALVLLIVGEFRSRMMALACAVAAVGLYFLESSIVTPTEEVERNLQTMLEGFINEDVAAIDRLIADESPGLKETARQGLELAQLHKSFHMKDITIELSSDGQSAEAHVRANGMLTVRHSRAPSHVVTRWQTTWRLDNGLWKLTSVRRLNPVSGEEMGILAAQ